MTSSQQHVHQRYDMLSFCFSTHIGWICSRRANKTTFSR